MELPMLEAGEWAVLMEAHRAGEHAMAVIDRERERRGLAPLPPLPAETGVIERRLRHLTAGYELFTGMVETNPNAVWHHVVDQYGPPCEDCGKPLRTPWARFCASCGWDRPDPAASA